MDCTTYKCEVCGGKGCHTCGWAGAYYDDGGRIRPFRVTYTPPRYTCHRCQKECVGEPAGLYIPDTQHINDLRTWPLCKDCYQEVFHA